MDNMEMIELMRAVIKEEIEPLNKRLDSMEHMVNERLGTLEVKADMTHRKIDNLEFAMKVLERDLKKDIHKLNDAQETLIAIMEIKGILPRVEGQ